MLNAWNLRREIAQESYWVESKAHLIYLDIALALVFSHNWHTHPYFQWLKSDRLWH